MVEQLYANTKQAELILNDGSNAFLYILAGFAALILFQIIIAVIFASVRKHRVQNVAEEDEED